MALTDIQTKITADAEAEAKLILKKAEEKARAVADASAKMQAEYSKRKATELSEEKKNIERITQAEATQIEKTAIAKTREAKIHEAFDHALTELVELSDSEYASFVSEHLKNIDLDSIDVVETPENRGAILKKALPKGVKIETNNGITGGFIAHGKNAHYDVSFEALIKDARERHTVDVAEKLFA